MRDMAREKIAWQVLTPGRTMQQTGELPVTPMKVLQVLLQLQELEMGPRAGSPESRREAEALRREVPAPILGHYDRLVTRGKKAVAYVRHGVCTGCQMQLPSGLYAKLLRDDDVCVCDNCARYLVVAPETPPPPAAKPAPAPKRAPRKRSPAARKKTAAVSA
jgi:hypothetical protein